MVSTRSQLPVAPACVPTLLCMLFLPWLFPFLAPHRARAACTGLCAPPPSSPPPWFVGRLRMAAAQHATPSPLPACLRFCCAALFPQLLSFQRRLVQDCHCSAGSWLDGLCDVVGGARGQDTSLSLSFLHLLDFHAKGEAQAVVMNGLGGRARQGSAQEDVLPALTSLTGFTSMLSSTWWPSSMRRLRGTCTPGLPQRQRARCVACAMAVACRNTKHSSW